MSATRPDPIRVLAVDDNPVVRAGLVALLEINDDISVIAEAGNGQEALELAERLRPDVTLLDVRMPLVDGVTALERLTQFTTVIMLTHTEDPQVIQTALRRGAKGYLVHGAFTAAELSNAVHGVVDGNANPLSPIAVQALLSAVQAGPAEPPPSPATAGNHGVMLGLSRRETEVMGLIAQGLSNAAIAHELYLSEKTVKNHVNRIYAKLQVESRAAAVAHWHRSADRSDARRDGPVPPSRTQKSWAP
ncbi:response regulator [Allonocardiopsis opalescens]|uniref:LuxR family two component transcriptional regulator n=1 Tax=Allonocardiopsis opalescens TaxID=1144618 RepID=A0A2T0PVN7_9ACTN|nr:response regulator transcription factor [Allonocardiopsis opalescens]PRX95500.1 LuxR family two component transcriptional regulator [Allonocardiopsis opalescens]